MTAGWPPRPTLAARFYKAHGLGNDYLVFEEGEDWGATAAAVARVCHRHRGVGADGIVVLLRSSGEGPLRLRMFNPDGSEFERSGNGLRILASHLGRSGRVEDRPFRVEVGGEVVELTVHAAREGRYDVSAAMGVARSSPEAVGLDPGALDRDGRLAGPDGRALELVPVWVGNPHLVVFGLTLDLEELERLGPYLSTHSSLANGANVQLAEAAGGGAVHALVWERGVGHTSASGTSASAVAVASVVTGRVDPGPVTVLMEGGALEVTVGAGLEVTLRGPVEEVAEGELAPGLVEELRRLGA